MSHAFSYCCLGMGVPGPHVQCDTSKQSYGVTNASAILRFAVAENITCAILLLISLCCELLIT